MSHTALPPDGSFGRKHFQTSPRSRNYLARGENSLLQFGASSPQTPGTPVGVAWPSRSFAVLEGQGSCRSRDLGGFGSGKPGKPGLGSAGAGTAQGRLREGDPPVPGSIFSFLAPTAGKHGRDEPPSSSARLLPVFVPVSVPPPGPGPCGQGRTGMSGRETTGPKRGCARRTPAGTGRQLRLRQRRPGVTGGFTPAPQNSGCFCR